MEPSISHLTGYNAKRLLVFSLAGSKADNPVGITAFPLSFSENYNNLLLPVLYCLQ